MTTLAIVPASGSITATRTVCRVSVADAPANDTAEYDPLIYPTSPEITYYLAFTLGGTEYGRSYVFAPNGGSHVFNNYIFPDDGSWTVTLHVASDDSSEATLAVTVAAP